MKRLLHKVKAALNDPATPPADIQAESVSVGTSNLEVREAWLEKTLRKIPKGKKILDAGAGELQYEPYCRHLKYVSQDFGQYNGQGNEEGLQTETWDNSKLDIISDIADIPVKNGSFDAIMCIEVFEHISHPNNAVKEFSRILKKGGTLIITTPVSSLTHFAPYYFYNGYSRYYFEKVLGDNDFNIKEITFNGNFFEYVAQELRRIEFVGDKYTSVAAAFTPEETAARNIILQKLQGLSQADKGSSELLSLGIMVVATRK
jgi:ubiquinone/menaquinone biosynthesis C-methylase UbiE